MIDLNFGFGHPIIFGANVNSEVRYRITSDVVDNEVTKTDETRQQKK